MSTHRLVVIVFCMGVIASDLYARRVSNRWLLAGLAVGVLLHVDAWRLGQAGFPGSALLGLAVGLVALLPFHAVGWMGAGDVKFFSVIGFLLGWQALLPVWIIASLLAGAHATAAVLARYRDGAWIPLHLQLFLHGTQVRPGVHGWWARMLAARQGRKGIPYAAYLGIGVLAWILVPGVRT